MELSLSPWEAPETPERRTEVPEPSNFVLAPTQAVVLGRPIAEAPDVQTMPMSFRPFR